MEFSSDIEDLIVRSGNGDRLAFAHLYDATSAAIFGLCLHLLSSRGDAEDVLEQAYGLIWQKAGSFKAEGYSANTWLRTVTLAIAKEKMRERGLLASNTSGVGTVQEPDFVKLSDEAVPIHPPRIFRQQVLDSIFREEAQAKTGWPWFLRGIWGSLVSATAMAVIFVLVFPVAMDRLTPAATYRAEIAAEDRSMIMLASFRRDILTIERVSGGPERGKVLELWVVQGDGKAPLSLGVLPNRATVEIKIDSAYLSAVPGAMLAVSNEPPGGSQTGEPSTPSLALGQLLEL